MLQPIFNLNPNPCLHSVLEELVQLNSESHKHTSCWFCCCSLTKQVGHFFGRPSFCLGEFCYGICVLTILCTPLVHGPLGQPPHPTKPLCGWSMLHCTPSSLRPVAQHGTAQQDYPILFAFHSKWPLLPSTDPPRRIPHSLCGHPITPYISNRWGSQIAFDAWLVFACLCSD